MIFELKAICLLFFAIIFDILKVVIILVKDLRLVTPDRYLKSVILCLSSMSIEIVMKNDHLLSVFDMHHDNEVEAPKESQRRGHKHKLRFPLQVSASTLYLDEKC